MTDRPIVLVVHKLGRGGAEKATLDQARMFARAGRDVTVVTFDDDPTHSTTIGEKLGGRDLPDAVRLLNIHEVHCAATHSTLPHDEFTGIVERLVGRTAPTGGADPLESERFVEQGRDSHGDYLRTFDGTGDLLDFTRLDSVGEVKHINYYENALRVRQDKYIGGFAHVRTLFNADDAPIRELFLAPDGFCYAQRWVDPETGRGRGVFVLDRDAGTATRHSGIPAWHVAWLQEIVDGFDVPPLVVAEAPSAIPKVMDLRPGSAVRMAMMHNSHLAAPFEIDSDLRPDYAETFTRLDDLEGFLVLSERQRRDMVERIGGQDVMTVVPNVVPLPEPVEVETDGHLVAVVSRLAPQKALHEAVHAFALVLAEMPEARLEIYGDGPSRKDVSALIKKLGVADQVRLAGLTDEPLTVMARSACTVATSDWEALPLSIAESLAIGTPVVAYDCLYGPSTLIEHGATGFVVPRGDRRALADAILTLLRDPARAAEMGSAGREAIGRALDETTVLAAWSDAFDRTEERYAARRA